MVGDRVNSIEVSPITEQHILRLYPHLNKMDVQFLFHEGCVQADHQDQWNNRTMTHECKLILNIDNSLAEWLRVNQCIDLIVGEDGIVYKKKL